MLDLGIDEAYVDRSDAIRPRELAPRKARLLLPKNANRFGANLDSSMEGLSARFLS